MEPQWMVWARERMPAEMFAEFLSEWRHQQEWRDREIARLQAELALKQ